MNQPLDQHWTTAKDFVQRYVKSGERILAPRQFKHSLPNLHAYQFTYKIPPNQFEWILIHKGQFNRIDRGFLQQAVSSFQPVFANDVFVVLTSRSDVPVTVDSVHLQPLLQEVNPQQSLQPNSPGLREKLLRPLRRLSQPVADPQLDSITHQLNAILDRLVQLERTTKNLSQNSRAAQIRSTVLSTMSLEELRSVCRSACQTAYLGENTILCRVLSNYLLYGDTRDLGIVPHLCLNGFWEPWVTLATLRTLKPGWHCLDVGANHGYYSIVLSSVVGPSGRVLALEPNFRLAEMVRKPLELNGFNDRATVMPRAVSNRAGQIVKLVIPPGHTGHASIQASANASDEVMEVETVTIDQLTAEWPQVDFIKIDVEGAEIAVWQGMRETIRRNKDITIVLEFGANRYPNPRAFLEEILAEGFILRYIDYDTQPKEISIDRCLSERETSYWDLFLSRS